MGMTFTIDSKALEAKLRSMTDKKQLQLMTRALREGAKVYQAEVVEQAPERTDDVVTGPNSDALPPGALKSDVIIHKQPNELEYDVRFGKETAHVARFVDEGHRIVKGGKARFDANGKQKSGAGRQVGFVDGSGFFRRAFETATQAAAEAVEKSIVEQVDKAWKSK